jgi:hypothetical protein
LIRELITIIAAAIATAVIATAVIAAAIIAATTVPTTTIPTARRRSIDSAAGRRRRWSIDLAAAAGPKIAASPVVAAASICHGTIATGKGAECFGL